MKEKVIYSLVDEFESALPVSPEIGKTLDKQLKYFGKAVEGDKWCVSCFTLEPEIPNKHHPLCSVYSELGSFPEYKSIFGYCVKCGSGDISIDSSRRDYHLLSDYAVEIDEQIRDLRNDVCSMWDVSPYADWKEDEMGDIIECVDGIMESRMILSRIFFKE